MSDYILFIYFCIAHELRNMLHTYNMHRETNREKDRTKGRKKQKANAQLNNWIRSLLSLLLLLVEVIALFSQIEWKSSLQIKQTGK